MHNYNEILKTLKNCDFDTISEVYDFILNKAPIEEETDIIDFLRSCDISEQEIIDNWDKNYIPLYMFSNVNLLNKDIRLPNTIKDIRAGAFMNSKINSIEANNVTKIGASAFSASTLKNIDIPKVEVINFSAFDSCQDLEFIYIPDCIEIVKKSAFFDCPKLTISAPSKIIDIASSWFVSEETLGEKELIKCYGGAHWELR